MSVRRKGCRAAALVVSLLAGCSAYDEKLIAPTAPTTDGAVAAVDAATSGTSGTTGLGGAGEAGGGAGGSGAGTGAAGGGAGGGGTAGTASPGCRANPDLLDEVCLEICPERCNGLDDDCDLRVDEDEASDECARPHTEASCPKGLGACVVTGCLDGYRDCDELAETGCEAAPDDVLHCGPCNHACVSAHAAPSCVNGVCGHSACDPGYADCDAEPTDCERAVNTLSDCGGCGVQCEDVPNATASCDSGRCGVGRCNDGYGDCDVQVAGCEQSLDTLSHCGACGQRCDLLGSDDECVGGVCFAQSGGCELGYGQCDNDPQNGCEPLTSNDDCGGCGVTCDASLPHALPSTACVAGACDLQCEVGYGDCDGQQPGCETELSGPNALSNCGDCGALCGRAHAVASCGNGGCAIAQCDPGWGDCDGVDGNGCETALTADATCGSCDNDCATVPGKPFCTGVGCGSIACVDPQADCDGDGASCETDLSSDGSHCGACGSGCAFSQGVTPHATLDGCVSKKCQITCAADYADCDGDYKNGCEQWLRSTQSCGGCGKSCSIANATASCATGACEVGSCDADWADCDGDEKSCETALSAPGSCGSCTTVCSLPNAVEGCGGSPGARLCTIAACEQSYYKNCDGAVGNGCEVDTRGDKANCGSCSNDCEALPNVATAGCSGGACGITTCDGGFGDCTAPPGCETALNTAQNCGACGNDCDTALPHVATTTCGGGTTCQVTTCQTDWDNCDGDDANGCERDVRPPASGGLGPCLPDAGCVRYGSAGHDYFFCPTVRDWPSARARCQLQRYGDLVRLDSTAENAFVQSHLTASSWVGANDQGVEGLWVWADNGAPFWQVTALFGRYANWDTNEPNDSGDCGELDSGSGKLDDTSCAAAKPFVCEVSTDDCPGDPSKYDPGQCGCGVADTDADVDGYATCNESCDTDPNKLTPGVCGCGVADSDTDLDGAPDCIDPCSSDPAKQDPGQCGCGAPDTDGDGDGAADCVDACPSDATAFKVCFPYAPSNFDPSSLDFGPTPNATLDCGVTIIDTTDPDGGGAAVATITNWCGAAPSPLAVAQTSGTGPPLVVLPLRGLTVAAGSTLKLVGARPALLAVNGSVTIAGAIDASATSTTPGAGGNVSCAAGAGSAGLVGTTAADGGSGGGGGGFGTAGGKGGLADGGQGGNGGASEGNAQLSPLRGGCAGGRGGWGEESASDNQGGRYGGGGGGALQIAAAFDLTVASTGRMTAAGGGGQRGAIDEDGGGGGGSGGAILIEARDVSIDAAAWVTANGGGGGAGFQDGATAPASGDGLAGVVHSNATAAGGVGNNSPAGGRGVSCGHGVPCRYYSVSVSGRSGCAVRGPGEVLCWGYNGSGKLGDGTGTNRTTPVVATSLTDAWQVAAGLVDGTHTCALRGAGAVSCWGYNGSGQLGDNTVASRSTPVAVTGLTDAQQVAAGELHTCAVRKSGQVVCWGYNGLGGIGDGTTIDRHVPANVSGLANAVQVSAGDRHSCAVRQTGQLACWGYNSNGQLGDNSVAQRNAPVAVSGITDAVAVAAGWRHSCAVRQNGQVLCWGYNGSGQLGDGTVADSWLPKAVPGITDAVSVTAGYQNTCVLRQGGLASCWGYNGYGQLGDGTTTNRSSPIEVAAKAPSPPDPGCTYLERLGRGYFFCTAGKSWVAAEAACQTVGYDLAQIDDATEASFVKTYTSITGNAWIGGNDRDVEGAWRWADGGASAGPQFWQGKGSAAGGVASPPGSYSSWNGTGEPSDSGGNEDCAEVLTSGPWNDWVCTNNHPFICEGAAIAGPTIAAIDIDNISACALRSDGRVACAGYNGEGAVGDGTTTQRKTMVLAIDPDLSPGLAGGASGGGGGGGGAGRIRVNAHGACAGRFCP